MTEKKENVQLDKNIDPKEREKLESVRKADAAVKTMQDFTCVPKHQSEQRQLHGRNRQKEHHRYWESNS